MPTGIPQANPNSVVPELDDIFPNKKVAVPFLTERVLNCVCLAIVFSSQFASRAKTIKNCPEVNEV